MILNRTDNEPIGTKPSSEQNYTGLLGMLQRKEYTIIPKMEAYNGRLRAVDFTYSFWKDE